MKRSGGGVAAAFGFRYQYLVTVCLLLQLYKQSPNDWSVEVDPSGQDSADIIVRMSTEGPPWRVIQVKASLPDSSTTIGVPEARRILDKLRGEHPDAQFCELITNRIKTSDLEEEMRSASNFLREGERFIAQTESHAELTEKLLQAIACFRVDQGGGTGRELQFLLLRQLIDKVHEAGARTNKQCLSRGDVHQVLAGHSNSILASVLGTRSWGKCIQVPYGNYLERAQPSRFLTKQLPASSFYADTPRVAVLKGMAGVGKSVVAALYARSLLERVAFVLWLDASSQEVLESQVPAVLHELGTTLNPSESLSSNLLNELSGSPVPWLLVLDGVSCREEVDAWIPRSGYGQVIITTRVETWPDSHAPSFSLDAFDEREARQFLSLRLGKGVETWSARQLSACDAISSALSRWPLALEFAVSWIKRHGGSEGALLAFSERVDRLNLDSKELLPHGYPQTAVQVVLDVWTGLSPGAQKLASFLLVTGGNRVPCRLLLDALAETEVTSDAVEELISSGLITQEILTPERVHNLDELLTIHGFVQLIMQKEGISLTGDELLLLLKNGDKWVQSVTKDGHFREGATLVQPINCFLRNMVEIFKDNLRALVPATVSMHNLAQLAIIVSQTRTALLWAKMAFWIRHDQQELVKDHDGWTLMQLQTLSVMAIAAARLQEAEEVDEVGVLAEHLLKTVNGEVLTDPDTQGPLHAIRDVLHTYQSGFSSDRVGEALQMLNDVIPRKDPLAAVSWKGDALVRTLQIGSAHARMLLERGAWQLGVDAMIKLSNQALEEGALVDYMVDSLLDVGFMLMLEASIRPLNTPDLLAASVERLVAWLEENSVSLDEADRQSRYEILKAFTKDGPGPLAEVLTKLPAPGQSKRQLDDWVQLVADLRDQRESMWRRELLSVLPPSVTVTHTIDGGDQLDCRWRSFGSAGLELWVHAPGIITVTASGRTDPVREGMKQAGLLEAHYSEPLQAVPGWQAHLSKKGLEVLDAQGVRWVEVAEVPHWATEQIRANGGLTLIYADVATVQSGDSLLRGWITLRQAWWRRLFRLLRQPLLRMNHDINT